MSAFDNLSAEDIAIFNQFAFEDDEGYDEDLYKSVQHGKIRNPITGRMIKVNGTVYNKLIAQGYQHVDLKLVIVETVVEAVAEPIVETVVEPIVEPIVETIAETVVELGVEPIVETIAETVVELGVEPIAETVAETIAEPIVELDVNIVDKPILPYQHAYLSSEHHLLPGFASIDDNSSSLYSSYLRNDHSPAILSTLRSTMSLEEG